MEKQDGIYLIFFLFSQSFSAKKIQLSNFHFQKNMNGSTIECLPYLLIYLSSNFPVFVKISADL